jgi:hypothetical protein
MVTEARELKAALKEFVVLSGYRRWKRKGGIKLAELRKEALALLTEIRGANELSPAIKERIERILTDSCIKEAR